MATAAKTADTSAEDAKVAKEKEREEAAKARQAEREKAAKEREEAKAKAQAEKAEARAKAQREKVEGLAKENGLDLATVTGTGENGAVLLKDVQTAIKAKKAEERASRPKKASLTLSQRRAILNLGDAGDAGVVPKTGFNALPLQHLVTVNLAETFQRNVDETYKEKVDQEVEIPEAERTEGGPTTKTVKVDVEKTRTVEKTAYRLTDAGKERVKEINPKWQTWKAPGSATTTDAA